jgi:autotransporter-associated beta strand protein
MNQRISRQALARKRGMFVVASMVAGFAAQTASAVDYTWTRGAGNNNWDAALNWAGGAPPVTPPAGDTTNIIYAGTASSATTSSAMRQGYSIDSLQFKSDFVGSGTSTVSVTTASTLLAGATNANLTIGAGGITSDVTTFNLNITKNAAIAEANLILGADQTWATNAPAASTGAITFSITRPIVGTAHVTKTGTGVLVLANTAANSDWSGGIDLVAGSIRTGGATSSHNGHFGTGAISSTSANDVTITASTVNSFGGDRLFANDLVLGGTGRLTFGGSFNLGFTADSNWSLVGDKHLGVTFVTDHQGTISGDFGLTKLGGGMLILNGASTYLGSTAVDEGVVHVRNSAGLGTGTSAVTVGAAGVGTIGSGLELSNDITIAGRPLSLAGNGVISASPPAGVDANAGALRNRSGNNTWTGLVTVTAPGTYIAVDAGQLNLAGGVDGTGSARVAGAGLLRAGNIRAAGLQVDGTSRIQINANGTGAGRSNLSALSLAGGAAAPTATLDLTNNAIVLDYDGVTTADDVRSLIIAGRAGGWTGAGITSSTAAVNAQGAVGYVESSSLTGSVPAIFGTVDTSAVLVRYTVNGDANLNGTVEFADLVRLAQNYDAAGSGKVWYDGDFNYNGVVEFADLVVLAQNYNQVALSQAQFDELAGLAGEEFATAFAAGLSSVPEPTGFLGGLVLTQLLRRPSRR